MTVKTLPQVGRIEGVSLLGQGSDPSRLKVELQYTGPGPDAGTWYSTTMPLLDALYLLNLLEALSQQGGLDHLRRPPGAAQ
ncbi:hypothetical protein [Aquabacterium sp. OR-4]|uniref:hypothetical protein n=1 Tax=Aquabacterium sp. OR-4 TaxID=2978127 RepID=UPI0028C9F251|nr:hypothetical protein [Aquabacterium sp. OR-4]MDT7836477.1 hypothetical protein [Aquabacterium sp. OR-4]